MSGIPQVSRTSLQLYRDCLRLANHIGGKTKKGYAIRSMLRAEFRKSMNETDELKIENLKANAVRGLSNYLVLANSSKDGKLKQAIRTTDESSAKDSAANAEWKEL
ncbi:hypothetical protein H310_05672 [Aphanomyces invadans]|uniref:Complex 1 LYR protein domain-containing protein n=1 Tax=Aphanomyces invadans TaxID=157072 RepID=A0A024U762_9STRA|nr:hypothetical protein H310_05672 [Aphanomyces invadans]ETW02060.1 hypothetical protein H310_05672 [Aphanomyces invadans]|eukprot:XP_008868665.1 hypothetical protein H310_05672 [Aphanomyces invadans]